jgi:hypothetical protein
MNEEMKGILPMLALSLSPDVIAEIEVRAAKVHRHAADERPLDLARLRDATAELQSLIAEATHLERRALGQRRRPARAPLPSLPALREEAAEEPAAAAAEAPQAGQRGIRSSPTMLGEGDRTKCGGGDPRAGPSPTFTQARRSP